MKVTLFRIRNFALFVIKRVVRVVQLLPGRKTAWGVVYDSRTLMPLPFARVELRDESQRPLESQITDRFGRYEFLGRVATSPDLSCFAKLFVAAPGFVFPSAHDSVMRSAIFGAPYRGEQFVLASGEAINYDIPLDSKGSEIARTRSAIPAIQKGALVALVADGSLLLGLLSIPLSFVIMPGFFTAGLVFVFAGLVSLRIWGFIGAPFGLIVDVHTGLGLPYALITLHTTQGTRVGYAVSDEQGRYILMCQKGRFEIRVSTPSDVLPQRQVAVNIQSSKGWITEKVAL